MTVHTRTSIPLRAITDDNPVPVLSRLLPVVFLPETRGYAAGKLPLNSLNLNRRPSSRPLVAYMRHARLQACSSRAARYLRPSRKASRPRCVFLVSSCPPLADELIPLSSTVISCRLSDAGLPLEALCAGSAPGPTTCCAALSTLKKTGRTAVALVPQSGLQPRVPRVFGVHPAASLHGCAGRGMTTVGADEEGGSQHAIRAIPANAQSLLRAGSSIEQWQVISEAC